MTDTSQAAACPNDSSSVASHKAGAGMSLFPLGQVLATPGALELLETHNCRRYRSYSAMCQAIGAISASKIDKPMLMPCSMATG